MHIMNRIVSIFLFIVMLIQYLLSSSPEDFARRVGLETESGTEYCFGDNTLYENNELLGMMKSLRETAVAATTLTGRADIFSEAEVAKAMNISSSNLSDGVVRSGSTEDSWSVNCYYNGEDTLYYTRKDENFTLKYQVEMHFDRDIPANGMIVRIPAGLYILRDAMEQDGMPYQDIKTSVTTDFDGNTVSRDVYPLFPSDIAVPYGRPGNYEESSAINFNYYLEYNNETEQWEYVFWNYSRIASGTNAAFQVLYTGAAGDADIDIMKTVDGSSWVLQPVAELWEPDGEGELELKEKRTDMTPLTGDIDTYAHLESVNKEPMNIAGKSYGPELYTENQINRYAPYKLSDFDYANYDWDFENYSYVAWAVRSTASATQAYNMYIRDYVNVEDAELVGFDLAVEAETIDGATWYKFDTKNTSRDYNKTVNLVVRYPKDNIKDINGEYFEIWNDVDIRLVPYDKKDRYEIKHDREPYIYHDFEWSYAGDGETLNKNGAGDFYSWLDVYKCAKEQGKDKGDFTFKVSSSAMGYDVTHETVANYNEDPPTLIGTKKDGCAYEITTADDLLWAYYNIDESNRTALTGADYYFSNINISITDRDYDPYEDEQIAYQSAESYPDIKIYAIFADGETDPSVLDSNEWEEVAASELTVEKSGDRQGDVWSFAFNDEGLRRMPYRVKAVNTSTGYSTSCNITVDVRIRHTSPVFENYLNMGIKSLNNPTGVIDRVVVINEAALVRRDITPEGITAHIGVTDDKTKALYPNSDGSGNDTPGATARRWGDARLYPLTTHADSYKSGTAENDPAKGRVKIRYNLASCDGYKIYESSAIHELSSTELLRPGRDEVVFADLLPLAMQFDGAAPVYYGRLKDLDGLKSHYNAWDAEQVESPVVNVDTDIILNYNNTGRTLVKIHLKLKENADPALYLESKTGEKMWAEGWGVSFGAFYYWRDEKDASDAENIAAFLPDDGRDVYLLGENDTVFPDDGAVHDGKNARYNLFGSDLNGDGITGTKNVIYMHAIVTDRVAQSFKSTIEKLVRADADAKLGYFTKSATVIPGETYTYQISLQTSQKPLKNIVIYDYTETAIDRNTSQSEHFGDEDEYDFPNIPEEQLNPDGASTLEKQQNYWKGFFMRIEKDLLQPSIDSFNTDPQFASIVAEKGLVVPTYYYYYSDDAWTPRSQVLVEHPETQPSANTDIDMENPNLFLVGPFSASDPRYSASDPNRGWYTEDEWITNFGDGNWNKCHGIAIHMHHFILPSYSYLTFRYQMCSPDHDVSLSGKDHDFYNETKHNHDGSEGGIPATYAFNDVKYLGTDVENIESEDGETKVTTSAPVKVNLLSTKTVDVVKEYADDNVMPDGMDDISFTFRAEVRLPHDTEFTDFVRKRYTLWEKNDLDEWTRVDMIPHSTDDSGYFSIKANQKAMFINVDSKSDLKITEAPNPFWECTEVSELYRNVDDETELLFYRVGNAFYADKNSTTEMLFYKDGDNYYDKDGELITGEQREAIVAAIISSDYELVKRINKYRPVVYFEKKLTALPDTADVQWLKNWDFSFVLKADGVPVANKSFWIVSEALTGGGVPTRIGEGATGPNGEFTLKAGQVIALYPGDDGTSYTIEELQTEEYTYNGNTYVFSDYWKAQEDAVSDITKLTGDSKSITNIYKIKNLYVAKALEGQSLEDYRANLDSNDEIRTFTFEIRDEGRNLVTGKDYIAYDENSIQVAQGTIGADGRFTIQAGWTAKIENLEAEMTYYIKEVEFDEDYQPVEDEKLVHMPLRSGSAKLTFYNKWSFKPVKISKMVTYGSDITSDELREINNKAFKMCIMVRDSDEDEWRAYGGMEFTRSGGSYAEASAVVTDENGYFYIHQNETVTFPEMGRITDNPYIQYKIFEFKDNKYGQIYPAVDNDDDIAVGEPQTPITGVMNGEEVSTMIVNGKKGVLILGKEYVTASNAGDTASERAIAQEYLNHLRTAAAARESEKVKLTLEVEYERGGSTSWERWPAQTVNVMTIDLLDEHLGESYTDDFGNDKVYGVNDLEWEAGTTMYVEPWMQIVINNLESGFDTSKTWTGKYRVYEDTRDRHKLYTTEEKRVSPDGGFIEINGQTPEIEDSRDSRPVAILTNDITGIVPKSVIRKRMLSGSSEITENSDLVFKLEISNGSAWVPAQGIPYMIGTFDSRSAEEGADESGITYLDDTILSTEYQYTDEDGRIVVQKKNLRNAENGKYIMPRIIFPENEVRVSYDNPVAGNLKISEVLEDAYSSAEWGKYVRLESEDASASNNNVGTYTFVNGNREAKIEIQKFIVNEETPDASAVFSFELRQLTDVVEHSNITASSGVLGRRVPYNIYEIDNFGNEVQVNTDTLYTGNDGIIKLKHGQIARLNVVDETKWTVHEIVASGYTLEDSYIGGKTSSGEKLGDNLALLHAYAQVLPDRLEATSVNPCFGVYDVIKPEDLLGTVVYTNGSREAVPADDLVITDAKLVQKIDDEETDYTSGNIVLSDGSVWIKGGAQNVTPNGVVKISVEYTVDGTTLTATIEKPLALSASLGPHSSYNSNYDDSYKTITYSYNETSETMVQVALNYNNAPLYEVKNDGISSTPLRWSGQGYMPGVKVIEDGDLIIPPYVADEVGNYYVIRKIGSWVNDTYQGGFCRIMQNPSGRIILPNTLFAIEKTAFSYCQFSGTLEFPPSLKLIGSSAFSNASGEIFLAFNEGLEEIGNQAFMNAGGLQGDLILPDSLKKLSGHENFWMRNVTSGLTGTLKLPNNEEFTSLPSSAFNNCKFTGTLTIPEQMVDIGNSAFSNNKFTGELIIPENVRRIGSNSFANNNFTSLTFETDYLTSLEQQAFDGCRQLTGNIALPQRIDSVTGKEIFRNINTGGEITLWTEGCTSVPADFCANAGLVGDLTIPKIITSFQGFSGNNFNGTLTIEGDPNIIGNGAFGSDRFTSGFTAVVIGTNCPDEEKGTVTMSRYMNGGMRGFADSSWPTYNNVTTLTIGSRVGNIEGDALKGLKNLTTVYADTSLQNRIPDGAFYNRSNVTIIYQDIP